MRSPSANRFRRRSSRTARVSSASCTACSWSIPMVCVPSASAPRRRAPRVPRLFAALALVVMAMRLPAAQAVNDEPKIVKDLGYKQKTAGDDSCTLLVAVPPARMDGDWCESPPCYALCTTNLYEALGAPRQVRCCKQYFSRLGADGVHGTGLLAPKLGLMMPASLCGVFYYSNPVQRRDSQLVHVGAEHMAKALMAAGAGVWGAYPTLPVMGGAQRNEALHICTASGWLSVMRLRTQAERGGLDEWSIPHYLLGLDGAWLHEKAVLNSDPNAAAYNALGPFRYYPHVDVTAVEDAIARMGVLTSSCSTQLSRRAGREWRQHLYNLGALPVPASTTEVGSGPIERCSDSNCRSPNALTTFVCTLDAGGRTIQCLGRVHQPAGRAAW